MSLLRRQRLMQELGTLAQEVAFQKANGDVAGDIPATELQTRIDEKVMRTALLEIEGLKIDGQAATPESVIASGPVSLSREIAEAIAEESSLSGNARKN